MWDTCYDRTETDDNIALGTQDYTLIFLCCPYTIFYGNGEGGNVPETTKLGGLGVFQVQDIKNQFDILVPFQRVAETKTLMEAYATTGQNMTGSAFVWSSKLDFTFLS